MTQSNQHATVGEWVTHHPQSSRVFEALQIDYCCGGNRSLEEACDARQLNPADVLAQLQQALEASEDEQAQDWTAAKLAELCDHIEHTHHSYLKTELPRLGGLIEKVVNAHGANHPELSELQRVFVALRAELEPHMFKEEKILFPAIRQLEQSTTRPSFPFGTVANPIRMMEHEHDNAGSALARIRELTSNFQAPEDACNTYRAMLDGLHELELHMHQHVHKENNILFPRAQELEAAS